MTATAITIEPIGLVHTDVAERDVPRRRRSMVSEVEIFEPYAAGLEGIEDYSHLYVLFWMHQVDRSTFRSLVQPHGGDGSAAGLFATRSPRRPNPVGLAVVELLERNGPRLTVRRLDAFDGTPVIDIKPYDPYDVFEDVRVPEWWKKSRRPGN